MISRLVIRHFGNGENKHQRPLKPTVYNQATHSVSINKNNVPSPYTANFRLINIYFC